MHSSHSFCRALDGNQLGAGEVIELLFAFLSALKECNGQTIKCAVGSCEHSYVPDLSTHDLIKGPWRDV